MNSNPLVLRQLLDAVLLVQVRVLQRLLLVELPAEVSPLLRLLLGLLCLLGRQLSQPRQQR